jgi:peptidoglycan/LPS O-acetylase OafA/YrhL
MDNCRQADDDRPSRRVAALDGIRGVAIIWVVLHNAMDQPTGPVIGAFRLIGALVHPGWIGVQLFFGLSGFLITFGLLETQGSSQYFRNFYAKRALRILPLYYAVLLALLVVAPRIQWLHLPFTTEGQLPLWLFTANWVHGVPYGFAHFWSLAVEEQFYLLWPFVVWQLAPRRLLWCCIGISAAVLALRFILVLRGADPWTLYTNTACRMDALALGAAGACIAHDTAGRTWVQARSHSILLLSAALFVAGIPLTHVYDRYRVAGETFGYTLLAACSAAFVMAVSLPARPGKVTAALAWAPLRSVGKYSYAMYVFHGLLNKLIGEAWLSQHFGHSPAAYVVFLYALVLLAVSAALGFCSYELLEKHFLKLKTLFEPRVLPESA